MAAADQSSKVHKILATQEPTIHGFRSGLYGGKNKDQHPALRIAFAGWAFLWVARLGFAGIDQVQ